MSDLPTDAVLPSSIVIPEAIPVPDIPALTTFTIAPAPETPAATEPTPSAILLASEPEPVDFVDEVTDEAEEVQAKVDPDTDLTIPEIIFEGESLVKLNERARAHLQEIGAEEFDAAVNIKGSYENILWTAIRDANNESVRAQESIALINQALKLFNDKYIDPMTGKPILGTMTPKKKAPLGKNVTGAEGLLEFTRRRGEKPIKRVPLYNSGFYIDITAPSIVQLHVFFTTVDELTGTYGRRFGTYFYLYADLVIKQAIVDLFLPLIVSSNIRNWQKTNVLVQSISLNDLKVIILTIANLMYPEGYDKFRHVCRAPKCDHVETVKADLNKFLRYNFANMSDNCIKHMAAQTEVIPDSFAAYQSNLGFTKVIRFKHWSLEMRVPTIAEYLDYGRQYNAELLNTIHADNNDDIRKSISWRYYRSFTPWVKSITLYDGEVPDVKSTDIAIISNELDFIQTVDEDTEVMKNIEAYINSTEIAHVCYPAFPCPKCKHEPEVSTGYFTLDPIRAFFTLSVRRLI